MFKSINERPGRLLRELRRERGMTQAELGMQVGLDQAHVARIERGAVDLKLSTLVSLLQVFDLDLAAVDKASARALASLERGKERPRFA